MRDHHPEVAVNTHFEGLFPPPPESPHACAPRWFPGALGRMLLPSVLSWRLSRSRGTSPGGQVIHLTVPLQLGIQLLFFSFINYIAINIVECKSVKVSTFHFFEND